MDQDCVADLGALIDATKAAINTLHGKTIPGDARRLNDTQTMAKKIVIHLETSFLLTRSEIRPDYASIAVLIRAAYETYLLFSYVFLSSAPSNEKRYERWKLNGLRARNKAKGFKRPAQQQAADNGVMKELESTVQSAVIKIGNDDKIYRNGQLVKFTESWKPKWEDLAVTAGFDRDKAASVYAWLSGYAHGDSWAVLQMDQGGRAGHEASFSNTLAMVGCATLVRASEAYTEVMGMDDVTLEPELKRRAERCVSALWLPIPAV